MMFIDNLLLVEFQLLIVGVMAALFGARVGYKMLKGQQIQGELVGLQQALLPIGIAVFLIALDGEFTWSPSRGR